MLRYGNFGASECYVTLRNMIVIFLLRNSKDRFLPQALSSLLALVYLMFTS